MKSLSRVILVVCLILLWGMSVVMAQAPSDQEIKQILTAAKKYAKSYGGTEDKFEFKFIKKVNDYALVQDYPKAQYAHQAEGASIILKKINGKWVGQNMGTGLEEEELFK